MIFRCREFSSCLALHLATCGSRELARPNERDVLKLELKLVEQTLRELTHLPLEISSRSFAQGVRGLAVALDGQGD